MNDQAAEILKLKALLAKSNQKLAKHGIPIDSDTESESFYTVRTSATQVQQSVNLEVLASECQGGKTNKAIVVPVYRALSQGEFPIVIVPSRITVRSQTVNRIYGGPRFLDEIDIPQDEKDLISNLRLKSSQIGMYDTGCPANKRLDDIRETLKEIRKGWCRTVIALCNNAGISKVVALVYELLRRGKTVQIFVDEAHSCLDIKLKRIDPDELVEFSYETLNNSMVEVTDDFDIVEGKELKSKYNIDQLWNWLITKSVQSKSLSISGVTATISPLATNNYWRQSCLDINVTNMSPPSVYCGFDSFVKKKYSSRRGPESAFEKILDMNQDMSVVMFHANNSQSSHKDWGEKWIDECKDYGISAQRRGFFIDNGNGWCLYNGSGRKIETYKKGRPYNEPWQVLKKLIVRYKKTHILITGKKCMNMSNTYQKCDDKDNIFINHFILKTPKKSLGDCASVQQEIGRMCANDSNHNERFLWTTQETSIKLTRSYGLERHLRKVSSSQPLNRVDYKKFVRMASKDKFNVDGTLAPEKTGKELNIGFGDSMDELEKRFQMWSQPETNTKISILMKMIVPTTWYTREEFLVLTKKAGFITSAVIHMMNMNPSGDSNGYGYILQNEGYKLRMYPELVEMYNKYFKQK